MGESFRGQIMELYVPKLIDKQIIEMKATSDVCDFYTCDPYYCDRCILTSQKNYKEFIDRIERNNIITD